MPFSWLLSNIKLVAFGAAFLVAFSLGWYVHSRIAESHLKRALQAQEEALVAQCQEDKAITKGTNDALQKDRDDLAKRVAALKLQRPAKCVPVTGEAKLPIGGRGYAGTYISSDWLYDFGGECEGYRSQLKSCIKFIDDVWEKNTHR